MGRCSIRSICVNKYFADIDQNFHARSHKPHPVIDQSNEYLRDSRKLGDFCSNLWFSVDGKYRERPRFDRKGDGVR